MFLNFGQGPYSYALDLNIEIEFCSVGFDKRDRVIDVSSVHGLQNCDDPWSTGLTLQGRTCHSVSRSTRSDECHCSEEGK